MVTINTIEKNEIIPKAENTSVVLFADWRKKEDEGTERATPNVRFQYFYPQSIQEQNTAPLYTSSLSTISPKIERGNVVIPQLEGININNPSVTSRIKLLIRIFWAIVVSKALQSSFPVNKTSLSIFNDPAEKRSQVVLQLFTDARASQTVAFWENLEKDIEEWISTLDDRNRLIFLRDISMRIHWKK